MVSASFPFRLMVFAQAKVLFKNLTKLRLFHAILFTTLKQRVDIPSGGVRRLSPQRV